MVRIVLEKGDEALKRKVSDDGRVWGLTKYAGKEVTIIIPEGDKGRSQTSKSDHSFKKGEVKKE